MHSQDATGPKGHFQSPCLLQYTFYPFFISHAILKIDFYTVQQRLHHLINPHVARYLKTGRTVLRQRYIWREATPRGPLPRAVALTWTRA